ncbi:MAG: hypothetical protein RLZZ347_528 [Candidatus Parcubacteria bacterium]|jgi:hypothetical protein
MTSNLKVVLENRGPLVLGPNDHVATGGEGAVYKRAGTVVKVFTDSAKMRRDGMAEKIRLLAQLSHPFIVAPQGVVTDDQGAELGYYMPFADGEPLSRLFTNDFRQRERVTDKDSSMLVDRMREVVQFTHDHRATMVDANELNWIAQLGGKNGIEPRVLDVDSWAIGRWPAKVIMPSIRDWRASTFDSKSDWFAWGIVTFQVYTGIHPYKGTLDGYKPSELEKRMRANASVFTPGVSLNRAVRDFKCIPGKLQDWYRAVFQNGERSVPPSPFDTTVVAKAATVARVVVTATGRLSYEKLFTQAGDPVVCVFSCGVFLLESGALVDFSTKRVIGKAKSRDCEVVKVANGWLKADKDGNQFVFAYINSTNFNEEPLTLQLKGHRLLRYENRLFFVTDQGLTELSLMNFGKPILSAGNTWGVMINSTRWYDGVGIQDAMGATFVIAPFGDKACGQIRVKELDGLTPIAAKSGNRFVAIMAVNRNGEYRKIELTFDAEYKSYTVWQGGAQSPDLNVSILPKGVCATILEDGELIIFVPTNGKVIKVPDKAVTTEMSLSNLGDRVVYVLDGAVWSVSMKS